MLEAITRREFLRTINGATALLLMPSEIQAQRIVTYEKAIKGNERTKQDWIDQVVFGITPPYVVGVKFGNRNLLGELRNKLNYIPPEGAWAATIALGKNGSIDHLTFASDEDVGKGAKSIVVVFPNAFFDLYDQNSELERLNPRPNLYLDSGLLVSNVILNNEFTDALHFNSGIPGYSTELFKDKHGKLNRALYIAALDSLSYASEYRSLLANPRFKSSKFIQFYSESLVNLAKKFYATFYSPKYTSDMDPKFIEQLKKDFNPSRLFRFN